MSGSSVLDLVIGLVFTFLLVSLICSKIGDKVSQWLRWRAKDLEEGLRKFVVGDLDDLLKDILTNPAVVSAAPADSRVTQWLLKSPLEKRVHQSKYFPKTKDAGASNQNPPAASISASTFVLVLFNVIIPGASGATTVKELRTAIEGWTTTSPLKASLLALVAPVDEKIETARKSVENWFNDTMTKTTHIYQQHLWGFALFVAGAVAILLNVDTIAVGTNLWQDSALRATVAAAASKATDQDNPLDELNRLNLPIGYYTVQIDSTKLIAPINGLYVFGWYIVPKDWVQPTKFKPTDPPPLRAINWQSYVSKLVGWIITALAGAQGAPFWFDLLKKLTQRN